MPRPVTRFLCRWVPRRTSPRRYTRTDAARIICYAIRDGAVLQEIIVEAEARCTDGQEDIRRGQAAQAAAVALNQTALFDAIGMANFNNQSWTNLLRQLLVALGVLTAISISLSLIPGAGRLARVPVAAIREVLTGIERTIVVQRAANDEFVRRMTDLLAALKRAA